MDVDEEEDGNDEPEDMLDRLTEVLDTDKQYSTITVKVMAEKSLLHQALSSASRLRREDRESEFLQYVVGNTSYLNMRLIGFAVENN